MSSAFGPGRLERLPEVGPDPPVSGYTNWYDLSDYSTLTLTGQRITAVADKGSGAQNLTESVVPTLLIRTLPSNRTAAFFAANTPTYLVSNADMSDMTSSAFVVACVQQVSAYNTLFGPNQDDGKSLRVDVTTGRLTTTFVDTADLGTQSNANVTEGVPFVAGQVLTASDVTHYLNGTSETDAHAQATTAARTFVLGHNPSSSSLRPMRGWIGEVILYGSALSSGDAALVTNYLMSKWKVT